MAIQTPQDSVRLLSTSEKDSVCQLPYCTKHTPYKKKVEEALITARRELLHEGKSGMAGYDLVPFISYQIFSACAVIYSLL
jgi:hypothetical protein